MNSIKLIVCDIDGTLIAHNQNSISTANKLALHLAKEKGIEILIATGRHFSYVQPSLFEDLNPEYLVTINGACFNKCDGTIIQSYPFLEEDVLALRSLCKKHNIGLGFKFPHDIVTYANHDLFYEGYIGHKTGGKLDSIDTTDPQTRVLCNDEKKDFHLTNNLPLGCFLIGDEKTIEFFQPMFPHLNFSWSYSNAYDVFPHETTKAKSIESFLKIKNLTWDETMTFGDAGNDVMMLQKAKIGVAMGNAKDFVKKEADFVTTSVHEDGIAYALNHFNII